MITSAIELARNNTNISHKVGCIITDRRGRILSSGMNSYIKTHPKQASYARRMGHPDSIFLHAEIHALVRCKEKAHTIYVARMKKDGSLGMAKPCLICAFAIKESGIKRIVYTDGVGTSEEWINHA